MTTAGTMMGCMPSRTTWLFEGEDVPVTETSALARLTIFKLEPAERRPQAVREIEGLLPSLPVLTRALVEKLLKEDRWASILDCYQDESDRGMERLSKAVNAPRVAKSAAAILCGFSLWESLLLDMGIPAPATSTELRELLSETLLEQMGEVEKASPGEQMLRLIRELLDCGAANLGEGPGDCIGMRSDDGQVVYIMTNAVMGTLARRFPAIAKTLPSLRSIGADLKRRGVLVPQETSRLQAKKYIRGVSRAEWSWPVRAKLLEE